MASQAILRRLRDIPSSCPPKHTNTDTFVLANKATVGCEIDLQPGSGYFHSPVVGVRSAVITRPTILIAALSKKAV